MPNTSNRQELIHWFSEEIQKVEVHGALTERMQALNYKVDWAAVCSGVSGMSLQAWLLRYDELLKLEQRFEDILETPVEALQTEAQRGQSEPWAGFREPNYCLFPNPHTHPHHSRIYKEMIATFDGITAYHKDRFLSSKDKTGYQSLLSAAPVVLSQQLKEKGSLVLAHTVVDAYQQNNLVDSLEKLKKIQLAHPNQRFGFRLLSSNHAMFAAHETTKNLWVCVDANGLPGYSFKEAQDLAKILIGGFSPNHATDFPHINQMKHKLETELSDLRKALSIHADSITLDVSPCFEVHYQASTNQFTRTDMKAVNTAPLLAEIYTISKIQDYLQQGLQHLIADLKPESPFVTISLRHLNHCVSVQYNFAESHWILLDEKGKSCGKTKKITEMTQWILSEFLSIDHRSVIEIEVSSSLNPNQSFWIRDPEIMLLIKEFEGTFPRPVLNQEKAQCSDTYGATLLQVASIAGRPDIAAELIELGADIHQKDYAGNTALYRAAQSGCIEIVRMLLAKGAQDPSALLVAALYGQKSILSIFLDQGADINALINNKTTLLIAAAQNGHLEVVELLLKRGAVNCADHRGITPLLAAIGGEHLSVVQFLLAKGFINTCDNRGVSPLTLAAYKGNLELTKLLLAQGATNTPDNRGITPLLSAISSGQTHLVQYLLTRPDTDITEAASGVPPLFTAAQEGYIPILQLLLKHDAKIDQARKKDFTTPLMIAVQNKRLEAVQFLLENHAAPNLANQDGITALHLAVSLEDVQLVKLLLAHGASNLATKRGISPLDLAQESHHAEITQILLEKISSNPDNSNSSVSP